MEATDPVRRKVVITGLGCLTPLGNNVRQTWHNLVNGVSGIDRITHFDASGFPSKIAGEVKNFDVRDFVEPTDLLQYTGRIHQLGLAAAQMAVEDAALALDRLPRPRIGVAVGATGQYPDFERLHYYYSFHRNRDWDIPAFSAHARIEKTWAFQRAIHTVACVIAKYFKLLGPNLAIHTACASGAHAIGQAMRIVQRGDADIMIAGGTDALASPLWLTAFILLGALSTRPVEPTRASCPFDARRDGFVMGEGAGMIVMETLESALRRGARIYAELAGYGTSSNAYRVTDPPADGSGAVSAMQRAIADAGSRTDGIDYIHAHGTSTPMNDATETAAIKTLFGDHAYAVPISSIKSMIGHLISGAGALNIISTALTIDTETIPPTINYEQSDPSCDLDYVPNQGRTRAVRQTLTNAFGFGGQNVSIVLKKYAH